MLRVMSQGVERCVGRCMCLCVCVCVCVWVCVLVSELAREVSPHFGGSILVHLLASCPLVIHVVRICNLKLDTR